MEQNKWNCGELRTLRKATNTKKVYLTQTGTNSVITSKGWCRVRRLCLLTYFESKHLPCIDSPIANCNLVRHVQVHDLSIVTSTSLHAYKTQILW